jgi:hypothetical protein
MVSQRLVNGWSRVATCDTPNLIVEIYLIASTAVCMSCLESDGLELMRFGIGSPL